MITLTEDQFYENVRRTETFFIGDVRDVIHSRAERVRALPSLSHGLGACGTDDPATAGESIVVRGRAAKTLPDADAGIKLQYGAGAEEFYTPFFLGWNGRPSLVARFASDAGVTLNQLYQSVFSRLAEDGRLPDFGYAFLELVGLFRPDDISDRALRRPVNRGDVLTTSAEHAPSFFKSRIIYQDLVGRRSSLDELFPLCVVGAGHFRDGTDAGTDALSERIFYRPPRVDAARAPEETADREPARVLSHNHALGWLGQGSFAEQLLSSTQARSGPESAAYDDYLLESLLKRQPDYLVHLDDWSMMRAGAANIYLAPRHRFNVQSA